MFTLSTAKWAVKQFGVSARSACSESVERKHWISNQIVSWFDSRFYSWNIEQWCGTAHRICCEWCVCLLMRCEYFTLPFTIHPTFTIDAMCAGFIPSTASNRRYTNFSLLFSRQSRWSRELTVKSIELKFAVILIWTRWILVYMAAAVIGRRHVVPHWKTVWRDEMKPENMIFLITYRNPFPSVFILQPNVIKHTTKCRNYIDGCWSSFSRLPPPLLLLFSLQPLSSARDSRL